MSSPRGETRRPEDVVEILKAFWAPHDFSEDLGMSAWLVLSFVAVRLGETPVSINELSKMLGMRWSKTKEILDALADSGFLVVTPVKQNIIIQIREPDWFPEVDENPDP